VKGSCPPPEVVLVAAPTALSSVLGGEVDGATVGCGAEVGGAVVGGVVVGGAVVGGAVDVVGDVSAHLSAGGSLSLPWSLDSSPPFQWASAVTVIVPVVPAGRSKWPENWLWCGANMSEGSCVTSQLAWGASASKSADPSGALRTLADQPFGKILLWLVALGLVALALWQASEVIWGYRSARRGPARPGPRATPPPPARLAPQPPAPWRRPHGKAGDPLTLGLLDNLVGEVGHPPAGCLVSSRLR
jgi:Domain of Unknown Function (DUF1206)